MHPNPFFQQAYAFTDAFWEGLKDIANIEQKTLSELVGDIDVERKQANLSSAIRLFVLNHYQGGVSH